MNEEVINDEVLNEELINKAKKVADYIIENKCSLSKAAKEFEISQGTVHNYVHKIVKKYYPKEYTIIKTFIYKDKLIYKISAEYLGHQILNGYSLSQLGREYDCHVETIKRRLNDIKDEVLRKQVFDKIEENRSKLKGKCNKSIDRSASVVARVSRGDSLSNVASEYGVTESTLSKSVRRDLPEIKHVNVDGYENIMSKNLAKSNLFQKILKKITSRQEYVNLIAQYMIIHNLDISTLATIVGRNYEEVYNMVINELRGYNPGLANEVIETIENNKKR